MLLSSSFFADDFETLPIRKPRRKFIHVNIDENALFLFFFLFFRTAPDVSEKSSALNPKIRASVNCLHCHYYLPITRYCLRHFSFFFHLIFFVNTNSILTFTPRCFYKNKTSQIPSFSKLPSDSTVIQKNRLPQARYFLGLYGLPRKLKGKDS